MSLQVLLFIIAAILAGIGAFVNPGRVSLLALAVCLIAAGLAVPGVAAG